MLSRVTYRAKSITPRKNILCSLLQDFIRNNDLLPDQVQCLMQQLFEEAMAIDRNILNEREPLHGETWYFFGVKLVSSMF